MTESPRASGLGPAPFRELLTDSIRYWEPRRVPYNLVLAAVVVGWLAFTWPHFRATFTLQTSLLLFILSVMANVCNCAAYLADIPMQYSSFRGLWRRWRWGLWLVGALFAASLAFFWIADEIYPAGGNTTSALFNPLLVLPVAETAEGQSARFDFVPWQIVSLESTR